MNQDLLTYAREIVRNDPPVLVSPLEFRRVIAELADRLEQMRDVAAELRRIAGERG